MHIPKFVYTKYQHQIINASVIGKCGWGHIYRK